MTTPNVIYQSTIASGNVVPADADTFIADMSRDQGVFDYETGSETFQETFVAQGVGSLTAAETLAVV